jgi:hypothetical protein
MTTQPKTPITVDVKDIPPCQMARIIALEAERQALYADYHEGDYRSADRLLLAARLSAELAAAWDLERRHRAGTRLGVEMYP